MDRFTHFALAATKLAIEDSKLNLEDIDKTKVGVVIGSGIGGIETLEEQANILREKGPSRVSPFFCSNDDSKHCSRAHCHNLWF